MGARCRARGGSCPPLKMLKSLCATKIAKFTADGNHGMHMQ